MDSLNDLQVGRFLGRYELLMPVAQGGMASVWAARLVGTRGFQKVVAIKTILPALSEDARFEQMFLDEAALASRIRHSNVAQVLDLGEEQGLLYQVMEWIDGEGLNSFLRALPEGSGMPFPIAAKIMIGACEGLHAAHELRDDNGTLVNLVHRDVSPQNILVSGDGVPKLVDFGVASASSLTSAQTQAGTLKGKPAYMAPEQIHGGDFDRRADIFALGVILYVLTTGRHPFRGDNELATLHNICSTEPPMKPSELRSNYPEALEQVIMKALEKEPNKRTKTAAIMARELEAAVPGVHKIGDADVATFMRTLLADRLDRRAQRLREALAEADQRAQQASEAQQEQTKRISSPTTFPGIGGPVPPTPSSQGTNRLSSRVPPPPRRHSRPSSQTNLNRGSAEPLPLATKKKLPPVTPPPPRPSSPAGTSVDTLPSEYGDDGGVEREVSSAVFSDESVSSTLPRKSSGMTWVLMGLFSALAVVAAGYFVVLRPRMNQDKTNTNLSNSSPDAATQSSRAKSLPKPEDPNSTQSNEAVSVESLPPAKKANGKNAATGRGHYTWPPKKREKTPEATSSATTTSTSTAPGAHPSATEPTKPTEPSTPPTTSATAAPKPPATETDVPGTVPKIRDPGL